jgi:hypothetical protein
MPYIARIAALAATAAAVHAPLAAQVPVPDAPVRPSAARAQAVAAPDSTRLLRRSRSEQAGFERYRANRLPRTFRGGGGGRACDERIGRFCIWYARDTLYQPREEVPAVETRRTRLLQALDSAAAAVPGDPWIAGQRVRYAVEAGEFDGAVAAARECRAGGWWCAALEGFALHHAGETRAAEAAFDAVLVEMGDDERRRWTDLAVLLPPGEQRAYRRMDDGERAGFERRFWWLADPLWTRPGNDRRTEHFARWVTDGLQERARSTAGDRWAPDLREILLRFGAPSAHERYDVGGMGQTGMVTYYPTWSWEFLPPSDAVHAPHEIAADSWRLDEERTRTSYHAAYAERFVDLPHQVARFRRGGRMALVAAYDAPEAFEARGGGPVRDGAVWYDAGGGHRIAAESRAGRAARAFRLDVPPVPGVLGVEALATEASTAARARVGVAPVRAAGVTLSDLLLLSEAGERPASLEEAIAVARGSTQATAGEGVALYWEIYGLPADVEEVTVAVSIAGGTAGWARRRLEALGVVSAETPVRVRWTEELNGEDVVSRSIAIGIPADARPGTYTLELSVDVPGQATAVAERRITVVR